MKHTGDDRRDGWAERLREARMRRFPTTWHAAKALSALDPHLPHIRELHRYWANRWEPGKIRPNRTYRELIERLLDAPGLFDGEPTELTEPANQANTGRPGPVRPQRPATSAARPCHLCRPCPSCPLELVDTPR